MPIQHLIVFTGSHWFVGAGLPGGSYEHPDGWPTMNLSDAAVGTILLCLSLVLLCSCLIGMVKVLNSLLQGPALRIVHSVINSDLAFGDMLNINNDRLRRTMNVIGRELAGYSSILIGCGLTILVQSSSVFTSALTPLVGMGLITVERMYPLTLGANIGTTVTSILAAFTSDASTIRDALQVAFAHLFFNVTAILIFYPVPFMRGIAPTLAKKLGNTTAQYRWFAVAYLIAVFFLFPALVFALSIPGWYVLAAVLIPIILLIIFLIIIDCFQERCPNKLPGRLRSWDWCPSFLCSLKPYDNIIRNYCCCCCKCAVCQEHSDVMTSHKVGVIGDGDEVKVRVSGATLVHVESNTNDVEQSDGLRNSGFDDKSEMHVQPVDQSHENTETSLDVGTMQHETSKL